MKGHHLIVDVQDIKNNTMLYFVEEVKMLLRRVIRDCRLNVVNEAGHQFRPYGATYVYVLSESHLSIHTYPEHKACFIDLFCCSADFDVDVAQRSIENLFPNAMFDFHYVSRSS